MAKYDPLRVHLRLADSTRLTLQFSQIESILGSPLPPSAYKHQAWWSNSRHSHVEADAWLDAGYRTERVDFDQRFVTFVKADFIR